VYGRIVYEPGHDGRLQPLWLDWGAIVGVPWDLPVVGYGGNTVNWLRLFTARPASDFDVQTFNRGDYRGAVEQSLFAERISKLLYPADSFEAGRELRLLQEYFLVACAIRDIVRRWLATHDGFDGFAEKNAIQLNDTHPTLAVPEFLRLLIDEHGLPWEKAWQITHATFAYTNHTLMAEALERWSVPLLAHVLPRHLQIIQEINRIFLEEVSARFPGDLDRTRRVSIIEESQPQQVRMANLAIVGSHAVNGVAKLHSELVRRDLVPDLAEMWPERFLNVTNGVTPRRWILGANPALAELVSTRIGAAWITDLDRFLALEPAAEDPDFRERFRQVKRRNKERLGALVENLTGVAADPGALFDVQIKRIHEYKRQLLAAMHLIDRYYAIVEDGEIPKTPRLHLFAGKAAPEYHVAKLVIRLVNGISRAIAAEPRCRDVLSVAFLPDYRVSLAERIVPAADLSEQISTAGKEASGTGNMKLALNGALTIGTLDGANVEIAECVGEENIYVFGLRVEQVEALLRSGEHHPTAYLETHPRLRRVLHALCGDRFCPGQPGLFGPLFDRLVHEGDPYLHLADFDAYQAAQARVDVDYLDADDWSRRAILNVARCGRFSSDRAIREYAERIWQIKAVP
jgi:starch phosphorylase